MVWLCMQSFHTFSRVDYLTAKILVVTEEMLNSDAESLRVTVSVNELCPSDKDHLVLVTFGTRPLAGGGGDDCVGQVNANVVIVVSSGDSTTFSVAADTVSLGDGEEYCYTVIVDGEIGEYTINSCMYLIML